MIPYGGSKSSGYIQMLLAKNPELFDFNRVQNPSANLRTRNEKAREAAERERMAREAAERERMAREAAERERMAREAEKKALTKEDVKAAAEKYKSYKEEIAKPLRKFTQRIERGYKNKSDDTKVAAREAIPQGVFKTIKVVYLDQNELDEFNKLKNEFRSHKEELNDYLQRFYRLQSQYRKENPKEKKEEVEEEEEKVEEKVEEKKPVVKRKVRKEEKPKEQPKEEEKGQINQERNEFFKLLIQMLSSKSTRDYRKFKKENPEFADRIENIVGSQKGLDFYPTPVECLNGLEDIVGDRFITSILEPSAGLGNILNWIEENKNKNAKVKAIEFNRQFINPLKELFPTVDVEENDFLEYKPVTNDFDCIVCNPPFNLYKANNVYIDFLFKCLYLLSSSTKSGTVFCIFICPMLTKAKHDDGDQFEFREIADKIGYNVVDRALKTVFGESLTKKEFKEYVDEGEDNELLDFIEPAECVVVKKECKGFGGTGAQAAVYLFKLINYRRGGKKRRC